MKRRDFLKASSAFTTMSLLPVTFSVAEEKKSIGLQLYTVRKEINEDLTGTLKKVAEIGYKTVELAGYRNGKVYGLIPSEFIKMTDDLGFKIISTHNGLTPENVDQSIEDCASLGVEYIVLPNLGNNQRQTIDDYKKLCEQFNAYGELCSKAGLMFAYHNHAFEFETIDSQIPYDVLLQGTDANLVSFELDIYWIKKAGFEPVEYFDKYPGRFTLWHVKDMDPASGRYTEVGSGNIDFEEIFGNSPKAGMQYYFVELDNSQLPALESIKISFDYLNKANFAR